MAAVVKIIKDTPRELVVKLINSDTSEIATVPNKIDVSTLLNAVGDGTDILTLTEIEWSVDGGNVLLAWDATADVPFAVLVGASRNRHNDENNAGTGISGDVALTTSTAAVRYMITASFYKTSGFGL